jgi:anaerobic selenocysteine-containing dehydrogenase
VAPPGDTSDSGSVADANAPATSHGLTRRGFVQAATASGAVVALSGLAACGPKDGPTDGPGAGTAQAEQAFYASCSPECQHHNLKAIVEDGKIVQVTAGLNNESLPCLRGLSRVEWLNTESRLTSPLLRDGEKGENKWKEISWDEALDLLTEKIKSAIAKSGNGAVVHEAHAGNFHTLAGAAANAFFTRIGGCTTLTGTLCCAGVNGATVPMFGQRNFDTRNTIAESDYIICWGNNPAVGMTGYFDRFERMREKGGQLVTIDPMFSESASKSSLWVPIRPTTDTALALGMLKIIIEEELYKADFLKARSTAPCLVGSDGKLLLEAADDETSYLVVDQKTGELARHDAEGIDPLLSLAGTPQAEQYQTVFELIAAEAAPWTPEATEAETGVAAGTVQQLARDFAAANKAMIIQNMGGFMRTSYGTEAVGSQNVLAVFCAQIGRAGTGVYDAGGITAVIKPSPVITNPEVSPDLPKIPRVQFAHKVLADEPLPIEVFISGRVSPMTQYPNVGLLKEAFKKIPFVVVIDTFITSTALYADLVLPCAAVFETEDLLFSSRSHLIQLSEKAIEPPGEAKDDLWIFTELARRFEVAEDLDHDHEFFISKALEGTDFTYEQLKTEHAIDAYPPDFIPYKDGVFPTASTKAELFLAAWVEKGVAPVPAYYRCAETVGGTSGLEAKYPLAAVQRKLRRSVHATFSNLELMENADRNYPCVVVNTEDAKARSIANGDRVVVYNDRGEHPCVAIVTANLMQGVVVLENGWTEQQGGSSSYVTNDAVGVLAGEHCCNETLVEVRKEA